MKNVTVIYDTHYGQTQKIAEHMKAYLQNKGLKVTLIKASEQPKKKLDPETDGVLIGSPVYKQKYRPELLGWVQANQKDLRGKRIGLFSVSLNAADQHLAARKMDDDLLQTLINRTKLSPHFVASLAGALNYRDYNWIIRFIMKKISAKAGGDTDTSRNYEYTDWVKTDAFLQAFLQNNENSEFAANQRFNMKKIRHQTSAMSSLKEQTLQTERT